MARPNQKTQSGRSKRAVESLRSVQRRALQTDAKILRARGLTVRDTATTLGVSVGTIDNWTRP